MPLWKTPIEVLGLTGEFASGKTLFALTIDPKNTLLYDFEKSAGTYQSLGFTRVDVPTVMQQMHPNGYQPIDVYKWWLNAIREIKPGQFTVIAVDTIGDIEAGLADFVKTQHAQYGFKTPEAFESMGGVFWKYVKEYWKQVLADLASRCETFVFTAHLRQVWVGGKPTRNKEPVGKQTLMELSSLYLWLHREEVQGGKVVVHDAPFAELLKDRIADTKANEDGTISIVRILPPRLPQATPAAIRGYMEHPFGSRKAKAGEAKQAHQMTEEEKLQLQAEIAENKRLAEESALKRAEMTREAHQAVAAAVTTNIGATVVVDAKPKAAAPQAAAQATAVPASRPVERDQLLRMKQHKEELQMSQDLWTKALAKFEVSTAKDLTFDDADRLLAWLEKRKQQQAQRTELDNWANQGMVSAGAGDDERPF